MVRILLFEAHTSGKNYIEAVGLSIDAKPTENIITGSTFLEVDTADVYFFDEVGETWYKAGASE